MQKDSVLVSSSTQLKPPQNMMPPANPTISNPANEKRPLGLQRKFQIRFTKPSRGGGDVDGSLMHAFRGDQFRLQGLLKKAYSAAEQMRLREVQSAAGKAAN
jgi:hypothetical protein